MCSLNEVRIQTENISIHFRRQSEYIETNEFLKNQKVELKLLPRFNVDLNLRLTFEYHIRIRLEINCLQAFRRNQFE